MDRIRRPARLRRPLRALCRDTRGGTAIEYGLIAALIIITMISAFVNFASTTTGIWNDVSTKVTNAR